MSTHDREEIAREEEGKRKKKTKNSSKAAIFVHISTVEIQSISLLEIYILLSFTCEFHTIIRYKKLIKIKLG
jgi:hypothetical protein